MRAARPNKADEMGLFNRKHQDGRPEEISSPQAQGNDLHEGVSGREEGSRWEDSELPTQPHRSVEEGEPGFEGEDHTRPPEPVETDPIAAELRELDAEVKAPEPEAVKPAAESAGQPGTLDKDELRRAVKASAPEPEEDDGRRSAEEVMAPTMRRRHPFAPEVLEPASERRMKVFAFANQKGGVAKTTTTLNLAVALSESGHRVLCVDLDPQGNLTMSQGIDPDTVERSLYHVLVEKVPIREIVMKREIDLAPASIDLAGAEIAMSTQIGRERSLQKALATVSDDYDFVCIDTPPSLGLLTINALTAADKVIVPVQCEYLSMRGLVQLQNTLEMIRENLNPEVQIEGILPTMLDTRTIHAKEAVEILEENFGDLVFKSRIRKAIKFAEAPVKGSSVLKYDPQSNAAQCYRDLAEEVLEHGAST
jgi:chromosome partitioning protein